MTEQLTGTELHSILNWSGLLGPESCRRVFARSGGFPQLLNRLVLIANQVVEGNLLGSIYQPGMDRRAFRVALLDRYLQIDRLSTLSASVINCATYSRN